MDVSTKNGLKGLREAKAVGSKKQKNGESKVKGQAI